MNFTDENEFCLTGQNPYMALFVGEESTPRTTASFWRVDLSPAGTGHVLFIRGDITNGAGQLFTDNIALARYIQEELYANNRGQFSHFSDPTLDPIEASFRQSGDARSFIKEEVVSRVQRVSLCWYDFLPPFKGGTAADPAAGKRHTHYALYIPARRVRLVLDETVAYGEPRRRDRGTRQATTCGLAWAETWVRPRQS